MKSEIREEMKGAAGWKEEGDMDSSGQAQKGVKRDGENGNVTLDRWIEGEGKELGKAEE